MKKKTQHNNLHIVATIEKKSRLNDNIEKNININDYLGIYILFY